MALEVVLGPLWNLHRIYSKDGRFMSRRYLVKKVHFRDVFSAVGLANILMFKKHASSVMYLEKDDDDW